MKQLHLCKNTKIMTKDHQLLRHSYAKVLRVLGSVSVLGPLELVLLPDRERFVLNSEPVVELV